MTYRRELIENIPSSSEPSAYCRSECSEPSSSSAALLREISTQDASTQDDIQNYTRVHILTLATSFLNPLYRVTEPMNEASSHTDPASQDSDRAPTALNSGDMVDHSSGIVRGPSVSLQHSDASSGVPKEPLDSWESIQV